MVETLETVRDRVAAKLVRTDSTTEGYIDEQIKAAVRYYRRKPWHFTEIRQGFLTTSAMCEWYTSAYFVESTDPCLFVTLDLAQASSVASEVAMSDIIRIDQIIDPSNNDCVLAGISYEHFLNLQGGVSTTSTSPVNYTRYGQQLGLYPKPSGVIELNISAVVAPIVPTAADSTSVFFEQASDLIEAYACEKVCMLYLKDLEGAAAYRDERMSQESNLQMEHVNQTATGRTVARN